MTRTALLTAAFLAGASGLALAQDTPPAPTNQGISSQVKPRAQDRERDPRGIGTQVREIARQHAATTEEADGDETDTADTEDSDEAAGDAPHAGLGEQVRELAHDHDRDPRGIGEQVRDLARPAEVTEARAAAQAAREEARTAREQAREAREQARDARQQAREARETAREARGHGRGG